MEGVESKATIRARERGYYNLDKMWHARFCYKELKGDLGYQEGVTRERSKQCHPGGGRVLCLVYKKRGGNKRFY